MNNTLILSNEYEYETWFRENFCKGPTGLRISDSLEIPVYFKMNSFRHAFFEKDYGTGAKTMFSMPRAVRMSLIKDALENPKNPRLQGWDGKNKRTDPKSCVCVVESHDFAVVVRTYIGKSGDLRANFITCYHADRSIEKIMQSKPWTLDDIRR